MYYHKSNLESYTFIQLWFHPSTTTSRVLFFSIRISSYAYTSMSFCPRVQYILYARVYTTIKIVSKAFLHFQARSFPFPRNSFSLFRTNEKRTKPKRRVCVCVFLRYFRVNAALGVSKPTICVEDYLICYVFLTNHKHPLRVETAEEWKGYSWEPLCRPTCREQ